MDWARDGCKGQELGNTLEKNTGMMFTTQDIDKDSWPGYNCAFTTRGGFWYGRCSFGFPTAKYYIGGIYTNTLNDGIQWRTWAAHDDHYYSMKYVDMKLRP